MNESSCFQYKQKHIICFQSNPIGKINGLPVIREQEIKPSDEIYGFDKKNPDISFIVNANHNYWWFLSPDHEVFTAPLHRFADLMINYGNRFTFYVWV